MNHTPLFNRLRGFFFRFKSCYTWNIVFENCKVTILSRNIVNVNVSGKLLITYAICFGCLDSLRPTFEPVKFSWKRQFAEETYKPYSICVTAPNRLFVFCCCFFMSDLWTFGTGNTSGL